MELMKITAIDYDTALADAHDQYGDKVRVVFRHDHKKKHLLSTECWTEMQFYVVEPSPEGE